ncbi:MAG: hypothetical protein ABIG03_03395 [Candidatus Eisenbacteria bacterium]
MTNVLHIDYWDLVSRSIRTAWKYKFLWFFGFFASSGGGNGNFGNWGDDGGEWIRDFIYMHPVAVVLIVMGAVVLGLAFLVMNIICTGGLIRSTSGANRGQPISFSQTWRAGLHTFWRILGTTVLAILTVLVVTALCGIPVVLSLLGGAPGIVIAVLIGAILFLPYIAFLFLLAFTVLYAEREIVLKDAAVFDALRTGWELTKKHFWKSMMVWLVMFLSGLIFALGLVISLLILAIPFVIVGMMNVFVALLLGIPVGLAFIFLASGAVTTYSYSVWTLAYEKLSGFAPGFVSGASPAPGDTMTWEPDPGPTGSDAQGEF